MATKNYLYKKSTGEWVFGIQKNSICPAGIYRLDILSSGKVSIRHIYNKDIAKQFSVQISNYKKENGSSYSNLDEFLSATADFFSGNIKVNLESGDLQIGAVELKNADSDDRAKIGAGSSMDKGDNALAVADPTLKEKMFPETGIHVLAGTDPAGAGTYTGFYALEADTAISSITLTDSDKVTGDNDFSEVTFQPGVFVEIPGGFTNITLSAGAMILIKG